MPMPFTKYSFVIPCYRSEHTVTAVIDEIIAVMAKRPELDYEIIAVNDCSPDDVFSVLKALAEKNPKIIAMELAKNMGRIAALMAGFSQVSGDLVVVNDDDGQCPLDHLFELSDALDEDKDVAIADYPVKKQSAFKNFGSKVNELMTNYVLDKPRDLHFTNFMVLRRYVVDEIIRYENPYPYMTGLILRTVSPKRIVNVPMEERERMAGTTGYTFKKMFALWVNGLTAFSVKPLRIATLAGACIAALGFLWGIITVIRKLLDPTDILAGYSSMMAVLLFIGGILMLMLGLLGEYIGRSYISINRSPQYVIRRICRKDENHG